MQGARNPVGRIPGEFGRQLGVEVGDMSQEEMGE